MGKKITQQEINNIVWKACDTFRGVIDPSQYKDYILTMLFLKYVSDVHKDKFSKYLEKYDGDKERAERAMRHERFVVPEHCTFDHLYENRNESNIGELINIALNDLEEANREKLGGEDGSGIFRNIDFNSSNLGDAKDKKTRLKNLLTDFSNSKLDLRPSHLAGNDIIGDAYEFLISHFASDAGKKAGEFYTPSEVSTLLAKLTKSAPGARIADITCGSGSLLIKAGREVGSDNFSLYGQEANGSTWALAVMNMFLHGFDNATVRWGDSIRNPKLKEGDALMKFDTVVGNPPFSLDKWGADEAAADPHNRFWRGVPPISKGDWAFISHMIETTYEGKGKVGVVVPHGVLFRGSSEGKIRQKAIEENLLEVVIGLPANLFFGTGIPAAILIFNRGKGANKNVLFIDASQRYEAGKNQNKLREQDINDIVDTYRRFNGGELEAGVVEEKFAYVATFDEVKENEYNLNIPRYVDTFEEEDAIDIQAVQQEIDTLEDELAAVQQEMKSYLEELSL
ncbi:type I restriction-modification system subunit M [Pontibacter sp. JH31]|uniref:site-specific DNA-methyltransferase (adenine-specific) n=1 Tax=Pontibacter aquaedesilientis TaxID=2766980 RepID=A0ABR7XEN8_9BACT|nr:type I restriction-modification system subunit M [Pontibacter aquaedesilientis]MBD1396752.1 type I restriction-modification system subunit M [Pontibacter aquaedesilientis]